ncbi:hypothetical protein FSP39_012330 [Pinctada imbricata]|uniref:Copper homeostasis protein cutC homolog n=1 Tax=Pinctada imbricata TaxID=66713 RepID=A0AA88Y699_PINIB|nr:hypothetical protein FSP39_012330 [Pinctada imbricata]
MEVCIDSVASATAAEEGGSTRVELCGNLMEGGTTPTLGMLKIVKRYCKIPVYVMIRPRGGDFLYNMAEFEVMQEDILALQEGGADGFVFGCLKSVCYDANAVCYDVVDVCYDVDDVCYDVVDVCGDVDCGCVLHGASKQTPRSVLFRPFQSMLYVLYTVMLKHRKCNHVGSVEDAAKEKKSSVVTQEIECAFSQMKDDLEVMIEERDENIKTFEGSIEQMKEDANKLFKEISTHIEWLKCSAFDEISALQKKILHEIKDDKQDLQHRISAVKNHLALFHTNVKYASPAQFLIAMEKLSEQKEICKEFTDEKKNGKRTVIVKCRMDKSLSKISKDAKRFLAYRVLRVQASSLKEPELLENITTEGRLSVSGIAFLTNDYLLASICGDKCLELWNDQYELVSTIKLSASPYGVKLTNDKDGAVVLYGEGLKFFTVHDDELREMKMLKMKASNDFVQVQKKYYICSKGKILVYNDRRYYTQHLPVAGDVWYICAVDDSRLCYTLYKGDRLFCITLKGSPVFQYSHDRLRNTTGVTVDGKKNIYVCGYDSKNVHQLDKDGKLLKIVLFNIPGRPWCISFTKTGEKVAIGCPRKVLIYESKDFAG